VDKLFIALWTGCGEAVDSLGIERFIAWGYQVEKAVRLLCKSGG
jgi:hypothetical protein